MNILFVSYYYPLGQGGFEKQARGLFETLIKDGHRVACLCVTNPKNADELKTKLETSGLFNLGVFTIEHQEKPYNLRVKTWFWFKANPSKFLASQNNHLQQELQLKLKKVYEELKIDVVHCLGLRTSYFLPVNMPQPMILDLVDSMSQHKKRAIKFYFQQNLIKGIIAIVDFLKTLKIEKDVLSIYSNFPIAVVSDSDAKFLKQINSCSTIHTVSHPIALKNNVNTQQLSEKKILVYYGFMNTVWNLDALWFLLKKIMPKVLKSCPDVTVNISGLYLPQKLLNFSQKREWINIVNQIEDINNFISQATLTCWPFRYGSGVKNKIIESMLLGKPVVTTTIGAEAFTEKQKQGLLIADNAEDLAAHIINLLNNPEECDRLGKINQQIVTTEFTWEKKAEEYLNLYKNAQKQHLKLNQITV